MARPWSASYRPTPAALPARLADDLRAHLQSSYVDLRYTVGGVDGS